MRLHLLTLLFTACAAEPAPPPPVAPPPVVAAPEVSPLQMLEPEGLTKLLTEPSQAPRLVNFWATWCGPCVAEVPTITQFAKDHPEVDVVLINVDVPGFREKKVEPFLKKYKVRGVRNYQVDALDPATALLKAIPTWPDAIPVTMAIRTDGTLARQLNRAVTTDDLEEALGAARGTP